MLDAWAEAFACIGFSVSLITLILVMVQKVSISESNVVGVSACS